MVAPEWLEPAAKVAEIVGAAAGVLALIYEIRDKDTHAEARGAATDTTPRAPRGWLRAAIGLICVPLVVLILQQANVVRGGARTVLYAVATLSLVTACASLVLQVVSVRRQRLPLPGALRTLLGQQVLDAQRHIYTYTVGSAPPLVEIYVEQEAEWLPPASANPGVPLIRRMTLGKMLLHSRHAVLLGEPGVGKSTATATLLREQSAWLRAARRSAKAADAPYGAVIPIRLPTDLHGCADIPQAMAKELATTVGQDVDAGLFERRPPFGECWLIVIDGLDQILDIPVRRRVLELLGGWIAAEPAHHRLLVSTRPLLGWELGYLKPGLIGHFRLDRFDDAGLRQFAERWAASRKVQRNPALEAEPVTADQFLASVAPLGSLALIPLIATITALILEHDRQSPLPTSRDALYERYVQHLFASRNLPKFPAPPSLTVHGEAGERAWAWLRGNLRDLLEGTADLLLSTVSPGGVAECAVAWVIERAPTGLLRSVPAWEDALGDLLIATGLVTSSTGEPRFTHPSFAEYLAAGPRAKDFDPQTWLADAQSPDSRSLALFVLARSSRLSRDGTSLADDVAGLLLERGGADTCTAGQILTDGIPLSTEVREQIIDGLFGQLSRDDLNAGDALRVLGDLATRERRQGAAGRLRRRHGTAGLGAGGCGGGDRLCGERPPVA